MKNSLSTTGLSLVQAAAISNLIQQKAGDLLVHITSINNSQKTLDYDGKALVVQEAKPMPGDVVAILQTIAMLRATQAFLMVNIKAKDALLKDIAARQFIFAEEQVKAEPYMPLAVNLKQPVNEEWAWNQLSAAEANEFLEQEAVAAHLGQFFHKGAPLDLLRKDLDNTTPLEWLTIGRNTPTAKEVPVLVKTHHTKEQLLALHNELAGLHRVAEQRVNYFKAKVKNLVSEQNAAIAKDNAVEQARVNAVNKERRDEYTSLVSAWTGRKQEALQLFEQQRELDTNAAAALRIQVDARFQPVIDEYLAILEPSK